VYFDSIRTRPGRAEIRDGPVEAVVASPEKEHVQDDGRIRLWGRVPKVEDRYLRAILLKGRESVHKAFFDRGFSG